MSKLLEKIINNEITLKEGLERLLIVANKSNNYSVSKWCLLELNGYNNDEELPDYRKKESHKFNYTGINGNLKVTDVPLSLTFLDAKTIEDGSIFKIPIRNSIEEIIRFKDNSSGQQPRRDMSHLSGEVQRNTGEDYGLGMGIIGGVQCVSITQIIPLTFFVEIYNQTRTRLINLICLYEKMNFNFDKYDINYSNSKIQFISNNNKSFESIITSGFLDENGDIKNKIAWQILVPIMTGIISAVIAGIIVFFITKD